MSTTVKVIKDPNSNLVITPSKTKEGWGQVCVSASTIRVSNGIVNRASRMAWIKGPVELLETYREGQLLQGAIIRITSDNPFYEGQSPVVNPSTGELVVSKSTGKVIYQRFEYTDVRDAQDYHVVVNQTTSTVTAEVSANTVATMG